MIVLNVVDAGSGFSSWTGSGLNRAVWFVQVTFGIVMKVRIVFYDLIHSAGLALVAVANLVIYTEVY